MTTSPLSTEHRFAPIPIALIWGVFLVSGFAAMLYQIVWQRALLSIYGVNIESVTVVVTAFMVGLGVGSLLGGLISELPGPKVAYFATIEIGIGLFGKVSLWLIDFVGSWTAGASAPATFGLSFALVLVPTCLMGATLPVLVAYAVGVQPNVGRSVGGLYFVNTLGSAVAAFLAAIFLMGTLGMQLTVDLAANANLSIGIGVLGLWWLRNLRRAEA